MDDPTPKQLFLASLDRCAASPEFLEEFYTRFMESSQEIRIRFVDTDFDRQHKMLLRSLYLVAAATTGDSEGLRELRERAETHDRNHLNVRPKLYEFWKSSLMETAKQFDSEWRDDVEDAWNRILSHVIHHMTRYY